MAKNAANDLRYFLRIHAADKNMLAAIRNWSNLKAGTEGDFIWIKDLDYAQLNSSEIKTIVSKKIFYEKEGVLFLAGSLLPETAVPGILWTSIERALPVQLPGYNHNYFGTDRRIAFTIDPSLDEHESVAMIIDTAVVQEYLFSAPAVRMKRLSWVILNSNLCFIYGTPLLPLSGKVFWQSGNHFFPAGYKPALSLILDIINDKTDAEKNSVIIWNTDNSYSLIEKDDLQPLSLRSFKNSMNNLTVLH